MSASSSTTTEPGAAVSQVRLGAGALLGDAAPAHGELDAIASAVLGRPVTVASWHAEPVPYASGSPATGLLARVRGVTTDGSSWSAFVKVLQHPRHWRLIDRMPAERRAQFIAEFPWRAELAAWTPEFGQSLPGGLRVPALYHLAELADDRTAIWMEDITVSGEPWTLDRFRQAAALLGTLAANRRDPATLAACPVAPGYGLRRYYEGVVLPVIPWLTSHDLWQHRRVVTNGGERLRADLLELAARAPAVLGRLNQLPQALPHGDASPQNLLVPAAEPSTFVAIDIAFQSPVSVGFDLAQLLVGLVHAGQMRATDLPAIHEVLAPAYQDGMSRGQHPAPLNDVRLGYLGSLVIRAAFTSLPFREPLGTLSDEYIDQRVSLTRFIADLGLNLPA
jgi:hypothetical protein